MNLATSGFMAIRHGQTVESSLGLYTGISNPDLNQNGISQALKWRPFFDNFSNLSIYVSPLQRAKTTAEFAAGKNFIELDALKEWDLGELEGISSKHFRSDNPNWSLFKDGPPNGSGESPGEVSARIKELLAISKEDIDRGHFPVFISHGQLLKALCSVSLGLGIEHGTKFALGPSRASIFQAENNESYRLAGWNLLPPQNPEEFLYDVN